MGYSVFWMNSDEFKLIFGSDTESEDYIFIGFSSKDLIMADTNASSKKHSRSKRSPTTSSVQGNDMDATSQVEPCVRPCLNWLKSKQKFSKEDGPNGPLVLGADVFTSALTNYKNMLLAYTQRLRPIN